MSKAEIDKLRARINFGGQQCPATAMPQELACGGCHLYLSKLCHLQLMQTDDPGRIDRVLALAESALPLDQIATGPGTELGFGPAFRHHSALDYIVQDLGRFPGKGWAFVRAALQSPVIRNRYMAIKALAEWRQASWPAEAHDRATEAAKREPDEEVKVALERLLRGEPIEDDAPDENP